MPQLARLIKKICRMENEKYPRQSSTTLYLFLQPSCLGLPDPPRWLVLWRAQFAQFCQNDD
jgi:hypothetical protein